MFPPGSGPDTGAKDLQARGRECTAISNTYERFARPPYLLLRFQSKSREVGRTTVATAGAAITRERQKEKGCAQGSHAVGGRGYTYTGV